MLRSVLLNLTLVVASLCVGLLLFEGALRLVPNRYLTWHDYYREDDSTVAYQRDMRIGRTLKPDQKAVWEGPCFTIDPVSTNALGFRDDVVPEEGPVPFAVLGDSFVEALQVADGEHVSAILQGLLDAPVMSTALSGAQTVQELMIYRKVAAPHHPRVVVLFLFPGNDIHRNLCALGGSGKPFCGFVEDGAVRYRQVAAYFTPPGERKAKVKPWGERLKDVLRSHFVTYLPLYELKEFVFGLLGRRQIDWIELYRPDPQGDWARAWQVTEAALRDLKADVEADGAALVLAIIPEHITISRTWAREVAMQTGNLRSGALDPTYPVQRLTAMADALQIRTVNLLSGFLAYRDKHGLDYPYFGYGCDGHWSPLGHYLAALLVADYLLDAGLSGLDGAAREAASRRVKDLLQRTPREVLGSAGYAAIFDAGRYRGGSNIPALVGGAP
jgi:hypothetical protein